MLNCIFWKRRQIQWRLRKLSSKHTFPTNYIDMHPADIKEEQQQKAALSDVARFHVCVISTSSFTHDVEMDKLRLFEGYFWHRIALLFHSTNCGQRKVMIYEETKKENLDL